MKSLFLRWIIPALAVILSVGCATNGDHVVSKVGDTTKLADVVHRGDIFVTRTGGIEVPIAFTRVNQLAFLNPETKEVLTLPDGRGGKIDVIRGWSFDTTESFWMRALPGMLTAATGGIIQGEYAKSLDRQRTRNCEKAGGCGQSAPVAISTSISSAEVADLMLQLVNNGAQCPTGGCVAPVPAAAPTDKKVPPEPSPGNRK